MDTDDRTTAISISLPVTLRAFVEAQVARGSYASASEFVRELIHKARQKYAAREHLEQLLLEGIESGPASEWTTTDWSALRERAVARMAERLRSENPHATETELSEALGSAARRESLGQLIDEPRERNADADPAELQAEID